MEIFCKSLHSMDISRKHFSPARLCDTEKLSNYWLCMKTGLNHDIQFAFNYFRSSELLYSFFFLLGHGGTCAIILFHVCLNSTRVRDLDACSR